MSLSLGALGLTKHRARGLSGASSTSRPYVLGGVLGVVLVFWLKVRAMEKTAIKGLPSGNSVKLDSLHPQFRPKAAAWVKAMNERGIAYRITFTFRTPEKQLELKRAGKSRLDWGYHNAGLAFDFTVPLADGKYKNPESMSDVELSYWVAQMKAAGQLGKNLGMTWGGDWSKNSNPRLAAAGLSWDMFHLEMKTSMTVAQAKAKQAAEGFDFKIA